VSSETPDFNLIAATLLRLSIDNFDPRWNASMRVITDQLRLIWNARGAADIAQLDTTLSSLMGVTAAGPYVKILDGHLRALDGKSHDS
jgi:hypothetical protein